jgi:hypothetical protein
MTEKKFKIEDISVGDRVKWTSQSHGNWATKTGIVRAITKKGDRLEKLGLTPAFLAAVKKFRGGTVGTPAMILVEKDTGTGSRKIQVGVPRLSCIVSVEKAGANGAK